MSGELDYPSKMSISVIVNGVPGVSGPWSVGDGTAVIVGEWTAVDLDRAAGVEVWAAGRRIVAKGRTVAAFLPSAEHAARSMDVTIKRLKG